MFCKYCGADVMENDDICMNCGAYIKEEAEVYEYPTPEADNNSAGEIYDYSAQKVYDCPIKEEKPKTVSGVPGLLSFIFGWVGLIPFYYVFSIAAIILGNIAKSKAASIGQENEQAKKGIKLGIIGLILFGVETVLIICFYVLYFIFFGIMLAYA